MWKLKAIGAKTKVTQTANALDCQFSVNNSSWHFEQPRIAIKIIQKICNQEMDQTDKNVLDTPRR